MTFILVLVSILLLAVQLYIMLALFRLGGARTDFHVYRVYHPLGWFLLFYTLWFLIPQLVAMGPGHFMIGMEAESSDFRLRTMLQSQVYLITFLGAVFGGAWISSPMWPTCVGERPLRMRRKEMKGTDQIYIFICFIVGTLATMYLGVKMMSMSGFRSGMMKTTDGLIFTAIAFFGNFAFAVILSRSIVQRKYLRALATFVVFGGAVFFTGARGRLMFPLLLSLVYVFSFRNSFNWKFVSIVFGVSLSILIFSDVILLALKGSQEMREVKVAELFTKRNFDGFANFSVISGYDQIPRKPSVLITGARSTWMEHYFPDMWSQGVGSGSTIPGMFWIAGGWPGLILLGACYGAMLGAVNIVLRKLTDERLFWSYLFCMVWVCALGGNFQESMDKMVVAITPGLIWFFINYQLKSRGIVEKQENNVSSGRRRRRGRRTSEGSTSGR